MEIIPKPKKKIITFNLEIILFYLSVFVFVCTVIAYFSYLWVENSRKKEIAELEQKILALRTEERVKAEAEVLKYKKKISNFSNLIKDFIFPSKIFPYIEETVHNKVYFSNAEINFKTLEIALDVNPPDFYTLAQQFEIFTNNPFFTPHLKEIALSKDGKVVAKIILNFSALKLFLILERPS